MDSSKRSLERAGTTAAYLLLGAIGTAAVGVALLPVTRSVQPVIYDAIYVHVGPSEATETAILTHFVGVSVVAISVPMLVGDYLSDRLENRAAFARVIAAMVVLLLAFLAVALAGVAAFLTALVVLAVSFVGVPVVLRYRYDVHSGGIPAFVGGIPMLVLLVLLAGFGLGWGWGYVVTAQEVPESAVDGAAATAFDDVPEVREDLFAPGNCETDGDGRRVCYLSLRSYEHETSAVRFLARHGVRCPYQNAGAAGQGGELVARHDGTYYRVTCSPHGD